MVVPADLASAVGEALDLLMGEMTGLTALIVATSDGRDVAVRGITQHRAGKLGAMSSSMSALAGAVAAECKLGFAANIIIEAETGYLLMVDIPHPEHPMTLTAIATRAAVLGQLAFATRRCAAFLAESQRTRA